MATTETWTDKDNGKQERTEWHNVTVWGKLGEVCGQYLAKGRQCFVEGRLQSREYDDKDGVKRKVWDVIADKVIFLSDGKGDRAGAGGAQGGGSSGGGGWGGNDNRGGGAGNGGGNTGGGNNRGNAGGGQQGGGNKGGNSGGGGWGQPAEGEDPIPF